MRRIKACLAAAVLGFLLLAPLGAAAEGFNIVQTFSNGDTSLVVATYAKAGHTVGLLGIIHSGHRISYTFRRKEWEGMRALVTQAAAVQSGKWLEVGSMTESMVKSPSHLSISANQTTMQFVISDPAFGTYDFLLARSSVGEFLKQSAEATKVISE